MNEIFNLRYEKWKVNVRMYLNVLVGMIIAGNRNIMLSVPRELVKSELGNWILKTGPVGKNKEEITINVNIYLIRSFDGVETEIIEKIKRDIKRGYYEQD